MIIITYYRPIVKLAFNVYNKSMLNKNFKLKIFLVLFVITLLLFLSYLLQFRFNKEKNSFKSSTETPAIENNLKNETATNEAALAAKNQFLEMKNAASEIKSVNDALIVSQTYFTTNLQEKIQQNWTKDSTEDEKLNSFWTTIAGNVSLIEDVSNVEAEIIDTTHIRLAIATQSRILTIILAWENNAWRYNGEETTTAVIDETGKTYKIVTKEEAEYETVTDEKGQKVQRLKDGQAILDNAASASAVTVVNK